MHRVDREIGCRNSVSPMYGQGKKIPCPIAAGGAEHLQPFDSQKDFFTGNPLPPAMPALPV